MSIEALSDSSCEYYEIQTHAHPITKTAEKTQDVWLKTFCATLKELPSWLVKVTKEFIAKKICDLFFFPLQCDWLLNLNQEAMREQLKRETNYCSKFFDPSQSFDVNLPYRNKILKIFEPPKDILIPIELSNGQLYEITCRILETKAKGDLETPHSTLTKVLVPGIYVTIDNNITTIYPYLAAYSKFLEEGKAPPAARFFVVSENNLNRAPANIDEAGEILFRTLQALQQQYGPIDQVTAHSLGTIFLARALEFMDHASMIPKHICLDRGPSSIEEVSKKYWFGMGRFFHFLLKFGGWNLDLAQKVTNFYQKWGDRVDLVVAGVKNDHYFKGSANLSENPQIQNTNFTVLNFDPPLQAIGADMQHSIPPGMLCSHFLDPSSPSQYMNSDENFAEAIIRHAIERADRSAPKIGD